MPKYNVFGTLTVAVTAYDIEAENVEEAIEIANREYSGVYSGTGNGRVDGLVCSYASGDVGFDIVEDVIFTDGSDS